MAKLTDRQSLAVRRVNVDTVKAFCAALQERFTDPASGLGRAYLQLLVDEIRLDGNELAVTGIHRRLADAIGFMHKTKLGEVPSFVHDWRTRRDEPTDLGFNNQSSGGFQDIAVLFDWQRLRIARNNPVRA